MWIAFTLARLAAAGMLVWALARHPYSYFELLRIVTCAVCAFGIYCAIQWKKQGWAWAFGVLILLFNPLVKVALNRQTWNVVDVVVAMLFLTGVSKS